MNPFDFSDVSDVAETNPELAARVANASQDKINGVVAIFQAGFEAGAAVLSIAQIQVAAVRMKLELPADATIRKYINTAIEQGALVKVTRQTYAVAGADVEVEADATEEDVADVEADELEGM